MFQMFFYPGAKTAIFFSRIILKSLSFDGDSSEPWVRECTLKISVKIPKRLSKKISPYVDELNTWVHREGETQLTDDFLTIEIRDLLTLWLQLERGISTPSDRFKLIEIFREHVLQAYGPNLGIDGAKVLKTLEESERILPASAFIQLSPNA